MPKKMRADLLLVAQGLAESREKARRLIMAGLVSIVRPQGNEPVDKAGRGLTPETSLAVREPERFVSRGGYKLLTALEEFGIKVTGKIALDAGASTGGFTDCLLQHGAAKVYAVDVGHAQLHEKLRADPRVVSMEKVNLRLAGPDLLPEQVDFLVIDVSFISLEMVLPACLTLLKPGGEIIALVKPQFELGPHAADKGVVRDPALQAQALSKVRTFAEQTLGLTAQGHVPAMIKGPKGNQEYLLYLRAPECE